MEEASAKISPVSDLFFNAIVPESGVVLDVKLVLWGKLNSNAAQVVSQLHHLPVYRVLQACGVIV